MEEWWWREKKKRRKTRKIRELLVTCAVVVLDFAKPLPKFGEWDVNDPSSAEDFSIIFNKARTEKKLGSQTDSLSKPESLPNHATVLGKPPSVSLSLSYAYLQRNVCG
ncbi:hypothetical protein Drorol1_Dr00022930 [Drosera rotundifolia]